MKRKIIHALYKILAGDVVQFKPKPKTEEKKPTKEYKDNVEILDLHRKKDSGEQVDKSKSERIEQLNKINLEALYLAIDVASDYLDGLIMLPSLSINMDGTKTNILRNYGFDSKHEDKKPVEKQNMYLPLNPIANAFVCLVHDNWSDLIPKVAPKIKIENKELYLTNDLAEFTKEYNQIKNKKGDIRLPNTVWTKRPKKDAKILLKLNYSGPCIDLATLKDKIIPNLEKIKNEAEKIQARK